MFLGRLLWRPIISSTHTRWKPFLLLLLLFFIVMACAIVEYEDKEHLESIPRKTLES